jgi:hypothetical protein
MAGDYGQPEVMGGGRCFSLRSHSTSPLIESHQAFFTHRRKPYSVAMVSRASSSGTPGPEFGAFSDDCGARIAVHQFVVHQVLIAEE